MGLTLGRVGGGFCVVGADWWCVGGGFCVVGANFGRVGGGFFTSRGVLGCANSPFFGKRPEIVGRFHVVQWNGWEYGGGGESVQWNTP